MWTYIRKTPMAFWLALVAPAFFGVVLATRFWESESDFAVTLMTGFLLVAACSFIHTRGTFLAAFLIATFIAVVELGLVLVFSGLVPPQPRIVNVALSHLVGAVLAAGAAGSALTAARRIRPRPITVSRAAG